MADLSKLRFNGTDYNVKDASAPLRKFTNYSKTGNLPITSDDTTQTAIGKLEKALDDKINTSAKGTSNGLAELDANGKVPSSQLPSYVDDVLEYSAKSSFPATGETGKIYVDTTTNKTYRWSGSAYVEISESLALGETSSTAYRGDRGKAAYDHSQITNGNPHGTTGANTNLTGYSKGSSKDAVAATDTVNAAIAKHENRINANQTNILYALDNGAKNLLKIIRSDASSQVAISDDGSITVNHSAVSGNFMIHFFTDDNDSVGYKPLPTEWIGKYFSGVTTYVEGATFLMEFSDNGINWSDEIGVNSPNTKAKIPSTHPYYRFGLKFNSQVAVTNYALKPMIADEVVYNTVGANQPPSLPNYDLTRLEAEDRASLAEVVDSGAKNLLDFANLTFQASSNVRVNKTDTQITVSTHNNTWGNAAYKMTLAAGTYYYSCKISNLTVASGTRACIVLDSGSDGHGTRIATFDVSNGTVSFPFVWTGGTLYIFYYPGYANTANSNAFTAAENMICTKAAFGVSQKFVPWCVPIKGVYARDTAVVCSTTLTTTGIKFTATEKAAYKITATAIYYNSIPLKLVIKYKTNSSANQLPFCSATHADGEDVSLIASGIISLDAGGEFEVFAQYASSTSNYFYVLVEKIG